MAQSQRIRLGESRRVFRLISELRDLRDDTEGQERRAVDGLCDLVGATMGWATRFDDFREGGTAQVLRFVPGSVTDAKWLRHIAWWGEISCPADDMLLYKCLPRRFPADAVCGLSVYESEEQRRSTRSYEELGVPLGIRDSLAVWFREPRSDRIRSYALQRTHDDRDYGRKEIRLARLFAAELLRLHRDGHLQPRSMKATAELPPRLQRLVPHLLTGLGQKQIAFKMGLSYETVRSYTKELYALLAVGSREELGELMRR